MRLFLMALMLVAVSSCATPVSIFTADTVGKFQCQGVVINNDILDKILNPSASEIEASQSATGYSDCTSSKVGEYSVLFECKKPIKYFSFTSTKIAECHKFMAEH